jgi:serine/threonine-protein kinase RIO1
MVTERKVLHSDLSPYNLIIHERKGYFVDFDNAKFLQGDAAINACSIVS